MYYSKMLLEGSSNIISLRDFFMTSLGELL